MGSFSIPQIEALSSPRLGIAAISNKTCLADMQILPGPERRNSEQKQEVKDLHSIVSLSTKPDEKPIDCTAVELCKDSQSKDEEWKDWYMNQKRRSSEERAKKNQILKAQKKGYIPTGTELIYNGGPSFHPETGPGHGILHYLSTRNSIWMNPADFGTIRLTAGPDEWRGPISAICGRQCVLSSSRGTPNAWFAVELVVNVVLTHYSLRHGWCNGDGAMTSWNLLASSDGEEWTVIDRRERETALARGGYAHATWPVVACPPARFFKVQMVGSHLQGRYYMYCCGFEIYGRVDGQTDADSSHWGALG